MNHSLPNCGFLPTTKKEIDRLGWDYIDVILFTGDAYVDHPAFGIAIVARVLENNGFRVAIVPQPNWQDDLRDFKKLGRPRLFFGVTSGNLDSMVNHYTANKRLRSDDAYTPGNKAGARPDYAVTVYSRILKSLYPDVPVVLGGIEASMRRFTHYDYWSNSLMPSVLVSSQADYLIYGMAEKSIVELAKSIQHQLPLTNIPQLVYRSCNIDTTKDVVILSSHDACLNDKLQYARNFVQIETESNRYSAKTIAQPFNNEYVVANRAAEPISTEELDAVYALPYCRLPHPRYRNKPPIPAYEMIKHSLTIHRGCFGGCSFCTISAHQGKFISSRSPQSIIREVETITNSDAFTGHITDLGGPSANMYEMKGLNNEICRKCLKPSCIFPKICSNLNTSHEALNRLYASVTSLKGIKKLSIGSGIRYDLIMHKTGNKSTDRINVSYLNNVIRNHVSGRFKVAPEHTSDRVLRLMRKPSYRYFEALKELFDTINLSVEKKQQLIPYFISSHPGCSISNMAELAAITAEQGFMLEQVQDFTPTPTTLSTVMYYTGIDPYSGKKLYVARSVEEKKAQQKYFFWYKPENKEAIGKELRSLHKELLYRRIFKHRAKRKAPR